MGINVYETYERVKEISDNTESSSDSLTTVEASVGEITDAPVAVNGADENNIARSLISLSKRTVNTLKAIWTKIPVLGSTTSALSMPVNIATDDSHMGQVGAASDVDGTVHGQLRYTGEAAATTSTTLGALTDVPTAYNGAAEDGTAKSGIQLWKRMCNAMAAMAAPLVAACNSGNTSLDTTETSPVALQRDDSETYINGVSATTSGAWKNFNTMAIVKFFCHVTAWTSGTVTFSLYTNNTASDTGRILLHSEVLSAAGDKEIAVVGDPGLLQMVVTISDVATVTVGYKAKGA